MKHEIPKNRLVQIRTSTCVHFTNRFTKKGQKPTTKTNVIIFVLTRKFPKRLVQNIWKDMFQMKKIIIMGVVGVRTREQIRKTCISEQPLLNDWEMHLDIYHLRLITGLVLYVDRKNVLQIRSAYFSAELSI